mgnify:CR=1 FL=1
MVERQRLRLELPTAGHGKGRYACPQLLLEVLRRELSLDDDQERIAQFRLRSQLAGTDGSTLQLAMSGKVTLNGNGDVVVDRFHFTCE